MKVRTNEELSDHLSDDIAWRKKEISFLRGAARKNYDKSAKQRAMIRSSILVLYAHWEGFIKHAATCYLEYIKCRRLRYDELQDSLCALAARSIMQDATQSEKFLYIKKVADFFLNRQKETSNLSVNSAISTRANLNSDVLKEIVIILALDYRPYETKEKLIDNNLLHYRNNIAHGRDLYPTIEILEELYDEIIGLMNIFKNQIETAAINKGYRKATAT